MDGRSSATLRGVLLISVEPSLTLRERDFEVYCRFAFVIFTHLVIFRNMAAYIDNIQ